MILFRNNYYEEDERLFSTGNEELDDILEEVYYSGLEDGYDYAYEEREYADKDNKREHDKTNEALLSGAGVLGAGADLHS